MVRRLQHLAAMGMQMTWIRRLRRAAIALLGTCALAATHAPGSSVAGSRPTKAQTLASGNTFHWRNKDQRGYQTPDGRKSRTKTAQRGTTRRTWTFLTDPTGAEHLNQTTSTWQLGDVTVHRFVAFDKAGQRGAYNRTTYTNKRGLSKQVWDSGMVDLELASNAQDPVGSLVAAARTLPANANVLVSWTIAHDYYSFTITRDDGPDEIAKKVRGVQDRAAATATADAQARGKHRE